MSLLDMVLEEASVQPNHILNATKLLPLFRSPGGDNDVRWRYE